MLEKKKGFTLIELLIVVAIIAILAAIAIPNLLEAQVRAKVSRAKSDMRTIATGLETFRIDQGRYPPDAEISIAGGPLPYAFRLYYLTTPVSYMTSIPTDPFAVKGQILKFAQTDGGGVNAYAFPTSSQNWIEPLTYDYANRRTRDGHWEPRSTWANISANPDGVHWGIRSIGPDLWAEWLGMPSPAYDPTNGTASRGSIYWTGPGIGEDAPKI